MSFLTEWIANIILFIMLAVIIDLLLPNSAMQKYAKMVISLLLIVIILTPIFHLLSADINSLVAELQSENPSNEEEIKNLIDLQKKEIQASNDAYILENMAVQLKEQAKEELVRSYDLTIKKVSLSVDESFEGNHEKLLGINVFVEAAEKGSAAIETIQPVDINSSEKSEPEKEIDQASEIQEYLANIWEIEPEKISLKMDGGEGSTNE
ncbi:stage III sporulation protein AF [Metabacillus idriensis]|uniref:stage III sporulation protein AF n=1 Tax=Metabacillus idriensis TaxID=324768 RepID=UPI00174C3953|nr:stage III sporulation protein AF [Metabacillus idriensis]